MRLVAGFPFYIAAHARFLILENRASFEQRVRCGPKVLAGNGNVVSGPAVVELTPVDEFSVAVI